MTVSELKARCAWLEKQGLGKAPVIDRRSGFILTGVEDGTDPISMGLIAALLVLHERPAP